MEYTFHVWNKMASVGIECALQAYLHGAMPVVVCVGSDLSIGDSVGPVCGSMLARRKTRDLFIYGTLQNTVTAKEVDYMHAFLRDTHPGLPVVVVDAAVGGAGDIGLIKLAEGGLQPGAGANKKLRKLGDVGIYGIVAEKSLFNYALLNLTRLKLVWQIADRIAEGVARYANDAANCGAFVRTA